MRQAAILVAALLLAAMAFADTQSTPYIMVINVSHTPEGQIQQALQDLGNVQILDLREPGSPSATASMLLSNIIAQKVAIPPEAEKGAVVILADGWMYQMSRWIAKNIDKIGGVNAELSGSGLDYGHGAVVWYSRDKKYALIVAKAGGNHHGMARNGALSEIMRTVLNQLNGNAEAPRQSRQERGKSAPIQIPVPKIENPIKTMYEDNFAIPVPPGVSFVKISGKAYPVIDGTATVPKSAVPPYFTLKVSGDCAEIEKTERNHSDGSCTDLQTTTVCNWVETAGSSATVHIAIASKMYREFSYDIYLPKKAVESAKNVKTPHITIVPDPVIRIYLKANQNGIAVASVSIENVKSKFLPAGILSFGACDVSIGSFRVTQISPRKYAISFQVLDKETPIIANHVSVKIDDRIVIPQYDSEKQEYRATVELPSGAHRTEITADVPLCGQTIYEKTFTTGKYSDMAKYWAALLSAVLVTYVLIKTVLMRP